MKIFVMLSRYPKFTAIDQSVFANIGDISMTLNTLEAVTVPRQRTCDIRPAVAPEMRPDWQAETADAGLMFESYSEAALEDRSARRQKVLIHAILRPSCAKKFAVIVKDISLSGFLAEAFTGQPAGSRIWLTIPGMHPLEAEIMRNDGTTIGCAFTNLLNRAVLDNLVARYHRVTDSGSTAAA